jgi:hypothetical protein
MGMLVVVVLLLVIMPVLLYLTGWAVTRYTRQAPSWIGFPVDPAEPRGKPDADAPVRGQA